MDNRELLHEITKRLDEKHDLLREDIKGIVATQKDHEVRVVKLEGVAGFVKVSLVTVFGAIGSLIAYLSYKAIDIWSQK